MDILLRKGDILEVTAYDGWSTNMIAIVTCDTITLDTVFARVVITAPVRSIDDGLWAYSPMSWIGEKLELRELEDRFKKLI